MGFFANPFVLPALIGGAGNLIGSILDRHSARKANRLAATQMAKQDEFARMGIRWRVEDAIAAGLHPLAALSASGASMSPSFQLMNDSASDIARSIGNMGQDLSRAARAGMTAEEREMVELNRDRLKMENKLMALDLKARENPPLPSGFIEKPAEIPVADRLAQWQQAGTYPSVTYMRSPTGLNPIMPPELAEALESDQTNQLKWTLRYGGGPNVAPVERPSKEHLRSFGNQYSGWMWDYRRQEWRPATRGELEAEGRIATERKMKPARNRARDYFRTTIGVSRRAYGF